MPDKRLRKSTISNGIRVLTERIRFVKSVSLGIWINVGSRDERESERGLTHFTEHLIFKGTKTLTARQIAEAFDRLGADVNAATGREYTSLYTRVLDEHLNTALLIMLDMIENPLFESKEIDCERGVILEEISMHNDSPDEIVHDFLSRAMWGDHPLANNVLGEQNIIKNVKRQKILAFKRSSYVASRIVIAASGAIDHDKMVRMVEENLESLRPGKPPDRSNAPSSSGPGRIVVKKDTEQVHICIGSTGLPKNDNDRFALAIMDNIIGGSMSSRLFQKIREENGLAYSIYSFTGMFVGAGMVGIYCGTHPARTAEVIEMIEKELLKIRVNGFLEDELERAKNHIIGNLYVSMEDSGNRMSRIAKAELWGGEHLSTDEVASRVRRVSMPDLKRVFERTWGTGPLSIAVVGPVDEEKIGISGLFS